MGALHRPRSRPLFEAHKHKSAEKLEDLAFKPVHKLYGSQKISSQKAKANPLPARQPVRPVSPVMFVVGSSDGDSALFTDTEEALTDIEDEQQTVQLATFPRKHVPTLEDLAANRRFNSVLSGAIAAGRRFDKDFLPEYTPPDILPDEDGERVDGDLDFAAKTSTHLVHAARGYLDFFLLSRQHKDDENEDPPESLGGSAPIYIPSGDTLCEIQTSAPKRVSKPSPSLPETVSSSPPTFLHKLVTLFAGKRRQNPPHNTTPTGPPTNSTTSAETLTPQSTPRRPFTAWAPGNLPPSKYLPGIRPMALRADHCANSMAGILLDRDGDVWTRFWAKYPDPKMLPWACTCAPWQRGKTCFGACGKSGGEGLDGDVVEEYPYQMGKIW